MAYSFEIGPIRPPNESTSLLIRVTRNCAWNKCRFCISYKGQPFQLRTVEEIKRDIDMARTMQDKIREITVKSGAAGGMSHVVAMVLKEPPNESFRNVALWLYGGGENVFLQDADTLLMRTEELAEVIYYLRQRLPTIKRVTTYTRSQTLARKKVAELMQLRQAGLSRVHVGLESGSDFILQMMNKGEKAEQHIKGGRNAVEAGLSLSEYIILGLGGKVHSSLHAQETARVLNAIDPEFIRVRTLVVNYKVPLSLDIAGGKFIRATDEDIVREQRELIHHLRVSSAYVSDHISNLLEELNGQLPGCKEELFNIMDRFENMPSAQRNNFMVGRRVGIYKTLDDMAGAQKYELTEQVIQKLMKGQKRFDPRIIFQLMEDFI